MKHLLKSDVYRLLKTRSVNVCLIINIFIGIAGNLGIYLFLKFVAKKGNEITGINGISTMTQSFGSISIIVILTAIAITMFAASGFVDRTQKYSITKGYSRTQVYASGLITASMYAVIMMLVYVFTSTITATIIWGFGNFTSDILGGSIMVIGLQALLNISLASLMYMVAMRLKKVGEAITCNILMITFAANIICIIINNLVKGIDSSLYWITNNMTALSNPMPPSDDIYRAIIVSLGFCIVSSLLGILKFQKYEFK